LGRGIELYPKSKALPKKHKYNYFLKTCLKSCHRVLGTLKNPLLLSSIVVFSPNPLLENMKTLNVKEEEIVRNLIINNKV